MAIETIQTANEWVPVVNNLIKIVIPSLTTGVIALKIAKYNADKDLKVIKFNLEKDKAYTFYENRLKKIDDIAEMAEEYFYAADQVISHPIGSILSNTKETIPNAIDPERFDPALKTLNEKYKIRNKALTRIKILGIEKAESALIEYENTLREFIFKYKALQSVHGEMISLKEAQDFKDKALESSSGLYEALREYAEELKH